MFRANIIIKIFKMNKQFLNLGKALSKAEQQSFNGGTHYQNICREDKFPCLGYCVNGTCDGPTIIV